ncbi:hypothetical protein ND747_26160, partial [Frankia sp. R82]|nr:hypothetical protein [Frankia sp. R82]
MSDTVDEGRLRELSEASDDLHSDSMRANRTAVADYVEATAPGARPTGPRDDVDDARSGFGGRAAAA